MAQGSVELDLLLQRGAAGYALALRAQVPGSATSIDLPAVALPGLAPDDPHLLTLALDPLAYGTHLSAMLFADPHLRSHFVQARSVAETRAIPLRIRLSIASDASELHALSWETLQDPERGSLLYTSERVLFSRYLSSSDWRPVQLTARPELRALIAIANPHGLGSSAPGGWSLPAIDVAGELARARAGLGAMPTIELASNGQATLDALVAGMRSGCDILYLVCHGALIGGVLRLWLEDAQGNVAVTDGHHLVTQVRELARPPLLVVLISCQSGGTGDAEAQAALGPQLAAAGVPAVLAMQGNVTMATMAAFVPVFFEELGHDGQIDRAVAVARGKVRQEPDAWMPVLWMRLRDGRLWAAAPDKEAVSPAGSALHQLRAPVGDFVGRESEIAQLIQAARSGAAAAISGVRGMGGIGKTELAYVVAHQIVSDFPDAQIVVDLRGASDPLAPAQALQTIIRAFEPEDRLSDDLAELQSRYRSHLNGKRALILADDAHDAAQVRPLLPPAGSALLITSRYRFSLPGMHAIDLGTLALPEAETLLLAICPRIGEAAPALAKLCGYLPLALRISAGVLASDATLSVNRYLERLADKRTRLAALRDHDDPALDVGAVLALSYAALDPAGQATLCQLSVFVADFDLSAVQAIVTVEGGQSIEGILGDLYRRSLLDYDASQERYSLHDLVRVFARARLDAEVSEPLMLYYAQHYEHVARQAKRLYRQGGESVLGGLRLFDRERPHIDAGWAWVREQKARPPIDDLLISYVAATSSIGDLRYDLRREQIPQLEAALAAAQRARRRTDQGRLLGNLGNAYADLGEVRRAIELYKQVLAIMREEGDRHGEGQALGNLGMAYDDLGEVQRAIAFYEQSLEIAREEGNRRGEGQTLKNLGNTYASLGEVQRAIALYEHVLVIIREEGDRQGEGQVLGNLGNAYYRLGDAQRALVFYEEDLGIAREMGNRRGEGQALSNLGIAYADLGKTQQAIDYYQQALTIKREVGDRQGEGIALGNLGNAYVDLGEVQRAMAFYEQSLEIKRQVGDQQGEAIGSWNLGDLLAKQGKVARAVELMQVRVDYERSIGHTDAEAHAAHVAELRRQLEATAGAAAPEGDVPAEEPPA